MSSRYIQETPRMARLEFGNMTTGSAFSIDLGLWSPGYTSDSKAESVSRVKPSNLKELAALTPFGIHSHQLLHKEPVNATVPTGPYGDYMKYIDCNPADWASVGFNGREPNPDYVTKLRLTIKDQKVNLAQAVLEFRQAQKMFYTNADTIVRILSTLGSKNRFKKTAKLLGLPRNKIRQTVSNRWLEVQYGVLPLASDIHGACEELNRRLALPVIRQFSLRVKESESGEYSTPYIYDLKIRPTFKWEATTTKRVTCFIRQESLALSRLGYTNPLTLAWELLPYSFLVDYLIGVGNWLNGLDAGIGLEAIWGTVSTKTNFYMSSNFAGQQYVWNTYQRHVFTSLADAPLPTWKPSLGYKRIANVLALLSQLKR